jgi:transposase
MPSSARAPSCVLCRPTRDLNPIEMAFAKLKATLRKAAERTLDALWEAVANALPRFSAEECANYFIAAGYERV